MSLPFTMDDVRAHCSPPTNGWLPPADIIKMADEIDRLRAELAETRLQRQTRLFAEYPAERCRNAEAAIARVRELCKPNANGKVLSHIARWDILEAIEGNQS